MPDDDDDDDDGDDDFLSFQAVSVGALADKWIDGSNDNVPGTSSSHEQ